MLNKKKTDESLILLSLHEQFNFNNLRQVISCSVAHVSGLGLI